MDKVDKAHPKNHASALLHMEDGQAPKSSWLGDNTQEKYRVWIGLAVVYTALALSHALAPMVFLGSVAAAAVLLLQLYGPIWRCDKAGIPLDAIGLHTRSLRLDLRLVSMLMLAFFPVYAFLYVGFWTGVMHEFLHRLGVNWPLRLFRLKAQWVGLSLDAQGLWQGAGFVLTQIFAVALPEEVFFRGYLQGVWQRRSVSLSASPASSAAHERLSLWDGRILASNAFFALAHMLGDASAFRLLTFFPGLVFAWLFLRTGSVLGCVLFHAACNVLGKILFLGLSF